MRAVGSASEAGKEDDFSSLPLEVPATTWPHAQIHPFKPNFANEYKSDALLAFQMPKSARFQAQLQMMSQDSVEDCSTLMPTKSDE